MPHQNDTHACTFRARVCVLFLVNRGRLVELSFHVEKAQITDSAQAQNQSASKTAA